MENIRRLVIEALIGATGLDDKDIDKQKEHKTKSNDHQLFGFFRHLQSQNLSSGILSPFNVQDNLFIVNRLRKEICTFGPSYGDISFVKLKIKVL